MYDIWSISYIYVQYLRNNQSHWNLRCFWASKFCCFAKACCLSNLTGYCESCSNLEIHYLLFPTEASKMVVIKRYGLELSHRKSPAVEREVSGTPQQCGKRCATCAKPQWNCIKFCILIFLTFLYGLGSVEQWEGYITAQSQSFSQI